MEIAILVLVSVLAIALGGVALLLMLLLLQMYFVVLRQRWVRSITLPPIAGYTPSPSFTVGDEVPVHVHTTQPATAILLRLAEEEERVNWTRILPATPQSSRYDFWRGLSWPATFKIATQSLQPGMYRLQLEHNNDHTARYSVIFLLSPTAIPEVAVILATNTWQAYNDFGGLSCYRDSVTPFPLSLLIAILKVLNWRLRFGERHYLPSVPLPENRPNTVLDKDFRSVDSAPDQTLSHVGRNDWAVIRFLEQQRVPYGLFSDRDLVVNPRPTMARLLIFAAHSEYWSREMAAVYLSYLARGGKVLFVSGNNSYRKVDLLNQALLVTNFRVDFQEMAALTGLAYDARGYLSNAGYRVHAPEHWVFQGLGVKTGDVFATGPDGGASGFETDKPHPAGGACTILAIGCNPEGPAFIVYREHAMGGWIVNLGSVASAAWINRDKVLGGIIRNVIQRALHNGYPPADLPDGGRPRPESHVVVH